MRLNFKTKKWTIMVIPEASQSIIKIRLLSSFIFVMLFGLIVLMLYTIGISMSHTSAKIKLSSTQNELKIAHDDLQDMTRSKEQIIDQLQNEVIQLSDQAQLMKEKLEEMIKLEEYLRSLVQIDPSIDLSSMAVSSPDDLQMVTQTQVNVGGTSIAVTSEEIFALSENTIQLFDSMFGQIHHLQTNIHQVIYDAEEKVELFKITPSIWPTDSRRITSGFGYRKDPFTKKPSFHYGLDLGGNINAPIYATADGIVIQTGSDSLHGKNIIIDHSNGLKTWYMHLNKINVKKGDQVIKGQTIGGLGTTGRSNGPHLHYEVLKNGVSVNPLPYIQTSKEELN